MTSAAFLFDLSTAGLALVLFGACLGATALGTFLGRRVRHLSDNLSEPFGVLQAAMLGVVGLILAFGLSLALSRYEDRRAAIVDEANTIGTTYLRAQTLAEPVRSSSLELLVAYTESAIRLSNVHPGQRRGGRRRRDRAADSAPTLGAGRARRSMPRRRPARRDSTSRP